MALLIVVTQGPKGKKKFFFFEVWHCHRAQSYPITNLSTTHRPDLVTQLHPNTKEQRSINLQIAQKGKNRKQLFNSLNGYYFKSQKKRHWNRICLSINLHTNLSSYVPVCLSNLSCVRDPRYTCLLSRHKYFCIWVSVYICLHPEGHWWF